jgi:hypothetical protein
MVKKYLTTALIVAVSIWLLLMIWHRKSPAVFAPPNISIIKQQKEVASKETDFLQQIDAVNNRQVKLTGQIKNTKVVLEKAKIKSQVLKGQVQNHFKELTNTDSSTFLGNSNPDNISSILNNFFVVQADADSIQQELTQKVEELTLQKQTVIKLQQQQYISLKAAFNQSIVLQNNLSLQNKLFKKRLIKQKIQRMVFVVTVTLAGALIAKQVLK